jgi:hypothetical protein
MTHFVANKLTIKWSLEDVLSFYKRYEGGDKFFSFHKVISPEEGKKIVNKREKENWKQNFYSDYPFWAYWLGQERKEINTESDLPWYIFFDTKRTPPLYLLEELISQNPNLEFDINWFWEDDWTIWEIVGKNWVIIFQTAWQVC